MEGGRNYEYTAMITAKTTSNPGMAGVWECRKEASQAQEKQHADSPTLATCLLSLMMMATANNCDGCGTTCSLCYSSRSSQQNPLHYHSYHIRDSQDINSP